MLKGRLIPSQKGKKDLQLVALFPTVNYGRKLGNERRGEVKERKDAW